ncbi:uncharacterized protein LOC141790781 [Halichoeres trimaculatus]|uniref:uncharacterized protein LOC141790781 n=1 Tax=Halichoeres trimaculatus TaxID=147232 RepID=UPI003D9F6A4C
MSPSLERYLQRQRSKPTTHQIQPPLLPPPPHPSFQSHHPPATYPPIREHQASATSWKVLGTTQASDLPTRPFFSLDSKPTQSLLKRAEELSVGSVTPSFAAYADFHWTPTQPYESVTKSRFFQTHQELTLAQTEPSLTNAESTTQPQESLFHIKPSPEGLKPTSSASTVSQSPELHSQPRTETPVQERNHFQTRPTISTVRAPDQTSEPPPLDSETPIHQVNTSHQINTSRRGENETTLNEWLKRNTSQSPMTSNDPRVTQQEPSWLPVLEKHDIPIVVGVGVSLAFIFITVTFYSVVHKNEPVPTSRAAQRNLGVPVRHTERRAAGRTYENRAFEDDDCVAVIEQSPNTSDTRAQPPGPSLVTVQMEPPFEDIQEDTPPALDNHSVTVETYPEPVHDTKVDPFLEEEKGCGLSQPSIQLQCAEDWTSNRDNHSPCQDALPPPSSFPSRSPSPSPPSRPEAGLRSSLTLQSSESHGAPIHHSLSISNGNPPLLLSHHVSLGLTTVAVDVHFFPAATASMAVGTQVNSASNSASVAAATLANGQESEQSTARFK